MGSYSPKRIAGFGIVLFSLLTGCQFEQAGTVSNVAKATSIEEDRTPSPSVTPKPSPSPSVTPKPSPSPVAAANHEGILQELVGFGSGTTGGKSGKVVTVTSLADAGPGTLREAVSRTEPLWIRFGVSGTIALQSELKMKSNKTIDGRGADITLSTHGISIEDGAGNVIITYIKIRDTLDDSIRLYNGGSRLWVHHCSISGSADGAIDTTEGVTQITLSYVHISNVDKAMLIGASGDAGDGEDLLWTAHHNWYENVVQRLPFLRLGKAHSFNNILNWKNGTAIEAGFSPAQFFSENDILEPLTNKKLVDAHDGAATKFEGSLQIPANAGLDLKGVSPLTVFDPEAYYKYVAEVADSALHKKIKAEAGWKDVPWPN